MTAAAGAAGPPFLLRLQSSLWYADDDAHVAGWQYWVEVKFQQPDVDGRGIQLIISTGAWFRCGAPNTSFLSAGGLGSKGSRLVTYGLIALTDETEGGRMIPVE